MRVAALIRGGMLCRSCSYGHCRNLSTEQERIDVECPVCDEAGCEHCQDGRFDLDGCPNEFCRSVVSAVDMIDLFGKGLPPISGGVLDQSASFVRAVRFFENEEVRVRNERSG